MSDHEQCDDRINKALNTGHPGFAEFLAAHCDLSHRTQRTEALRAALTAVGAAEGEES